MTFIWTLPAIAVGVWVFVADGSTLVERESHGFEYITAYVAERALSLDNLFAFLIIFGYFALPEEHRARALTWGIVLALVTRGIFIIAGVGIIERFSWFLIVLGLILIYSAWKLITSGDTEVDPSRNLILRGIKRIMPVSDAYDGDKFFTVKNGVRMATPFLLVVAVLASTDIVFAVDSIPTVLAISTDEFVIWSSNALAVLGMRPLFFLIEGLIAYFRCLSVGLAAILGFIGAKMIGETLLQLIWVDGLIWQQEHDPVHQFLHDTVGLENPDLFIIFASLGVVLLIIVVAIVYSILFPEHEKAPHGHGGAGGAPATVPTTTPPSSPQT